MDDIRWRSVYIASTDGEVGNGLYMSDNAKSAAIQRHQGGAVCMYVKTVRLP